MTRIYSLRYFMKGFEECDPPELVMRSDNLIDLLDVATVQTFDESGNIYDIAGDRTWIEFSEGFGIWACGDDDFVAIQLRYGDDFRIVDHRPVAIERRKRATAAGR